MLNAVSLLMQYNREDMFKLELETEEQNAICYRFAYDSYITSTDEYARRNQFNERKIIQDIYNGKRAEFMVYNLLKKHNRNVSEPDVNIYTSEKKSYDADLKCDIVDLHIKSHVVSSIFPPSWVFQKNDPLVKSPKESDWIALCVLDGRNNYMHLVSANSVVYQPPMKESLRGSKVCIYELDL